MKNKVAQAGISIGIDNAVFYHYDSSIRLIDTEETDAGYLGFEDVYQLYTYNTGNVDLDSDGYMGHLKIDIIDPDDSLSSYTDPFIAVQCDDWESMSFIKAGKIDFNGYDIGSIDITGKTFPKWNLYFGAHDCGIDFEAGFQMKLAKFKYNYGDPDNNYYTGFSNLYIADEFVDSSDLPADPTDPTTWNLKGKFKIGNFEQNNPATFDIGISEYDNTPVISISAPMSGSIRMENIHIQDKDFGPAAIDGIQVHKLTIELPGRDLGNS
eukprot:gnl/Chilomastix_cuspidata/9487.p1 GENE.gnl/Chilomastix_cuspidata/9487~~gnl/Chilomastix_cuspidata/9487.p1  ORF type:complete len:300 (+),score=6.48 gnl/Chilomastix_cuspidata/9487:102-902(+)